ncbi:MAG: methyltransferase domain-containing protein [Myxococcota bacterium]
MDTYTHGHHRSVVAHHGSRSAEDSAAFLLPHLKPGMRLLDIGCGPGSITVDLARRVAPGRVVGLDVVDTILQTANDNVERAGLTNVEIRHGSVYGLDVEDDTFDVAYAHQVLQHLTDPVAALVEMARVVRPGGLVAVRDVDYGTFAWHPPHPMLARWLELYHEVTSHNDAEADAGRYLLSWCLEAGLDDLTLSTSSWSYGDQPGRDFWGNGWVARSTESAFARQAIEYGLSNERELREISEAWAWWRDRPDGYLAMLHTEALVRVK